MIGHRHVGVAIALVLGVALSPAVARGQGRSSEMDAIARNHYDNGNRYYVIHRYDEAAREFQAAYDISNNPELLFNLGRAEEDAGHDDLALDAYSRFVAAGSPDVDDVTLDNRIAGVRLRIAARAAVQAPVVPPPVTHPAPTPVPPVRAPVAPPSTPAHSVALPVGLMAGGGALLLTGLGLGVTVLIAHNDVTSHCPMVNNCAPNYVTEASNAHTRGYIGDGMGAAGIVVAAVGVVLFVTQRHSTPHVSAMCLPGGCAGSLRVDF